LKNQPSATIVDQNQEKKFLNDLINNNNSAYETLVRNYSPKMYAVARHFFSDNDDIQECTQKTFIQVFKNIKKFKQDSSLTTWLHRITVNEALMMIRQKKRQYSESLESFSQHYNEFGERTAFCDNTGSNIEAVFELNERKNSLNEIIYQLPEKYCNVILLRDIQEISTKETASILGITETSVKTQLHRGRQILKAILEQQERVNAEINWKVK